MAVRDANRLPTTYKEKVGLLEAKLNLYIYVYHNNYYTKCVFRCLYLCLDYELGSRTK